MAILRSKNALVNDNLFNVGIRTYNNQMEEAKEGNLSDEAVIVSLVNEAYSKNGVIKSNEKLRQFHALVVEVANEVKNPKYDQIVNLLTQYDKRTSIYDVKYYNVIDKSIKAKFYVSAKESGVEFNRIAINSSNKIATPENFQLGLKYSINELVTDPVNKFRELVNMIPEIKLEMLVKNMYIDLAKASTTNDIPASQIIEKSNITFDDFRKVENKLIRTGRNAAPIMLADIAFIDHLANAQAGVATPITNATQGLYLTDELKTSLLRDIVIDQVSKTVCIPLDNDWTDKTHTKTLLDPQEAMMVAGGKEKPFRFTEFGGVRLSNKDPHIELDWVEFKLDYLADLTLLYGENMAYLKDESITV